MIKLNYVITNELGIHARPAARLVKIATAYSCDIKIGTVEKMVDAKQIMGIMGLALKQEDKLTITFEGEKEAEAAAEIELFLKENL